LAVSEGSKGIRKTAETDSSLPAGSQRRHGSKDTLKSWRDPPRPGWKHPEKTGPITRQHLGKGLEARGSRTGPRAVRASNAAGAKGPC